MDEDAAKAKADAMIACVYSKSQEDNKPSEDPDIAALRAELEGRYLDDGAEKDAKKAFKKFGERTELPDRLRQAADRLRRAYRGGDVSR